MNRIVWDGRCLAYLHVVSLEVPVRVSFDVFFRSFDNEFDDSDQQRTLHGDFVAQYTEFFAEPDPSGIEVHYLRAF